MPEKRLKNIELSSAERIKFSTEELERLERLVTSIIDKFNKECADKNIPKEVAGFDVIKSCLNQLELRYLESIFPLDEIQGLLDVPAPTNLIDIAEEKENTTGEHKLPEKVYESFELMNTAMRNDIGCSLSVISGYRSGAYQMILFLWNLRKEKFDLEKVKHRVALPGSSEHGQPNRQAIDVMERGGNAKAAIESDAHFEKTPQYKWLKTHAREFGFYESYPEDNTSGIMWEPWHWHWEGVNSK